MMIPADSLGGKKTPANVSFAMFFDMELVKWRFDFGLVTTVELPWGNFHLQIRQSHVFDVAKQRHTHSSYTATSTNDWENHQKTDAIIRSCTHAVVPHAQETGQAGVKSCLLAEGANIKALAMPDGLREFELQPDPDKTQFFVGDDFLIKRVLMTTENPHQKGKDMAMNFPATTSTKGPPAADMWDKRPSGGKLCEEGTLEQVAKLAGDDPIMFKKCSGLVPNVPEAAMSSVRAQFLKAAAAKLAAFTAQHRTRLVV